MGPFVTPFDLLFAMCFLASVGVLLTALIQAVRGRARQAVRLIVGWAMGAAIYFAALIGVSLKAPQQVLHLGDARCFDDWCLTADSATRGPSGDIVVSMHIWSRAKRVEQRAQSGSAVYLTDASGRRWDSLEDPSEVPLTALLHAGESIPASRRFAVPADAHGLAMVVNFGSGGPGNLVIGDEASLFHKRTVYSIEP